MTNALGPLDPAVVALHLVGLLEGAAMPCAIGGSLALGAWDEMVREFG